LRLSISTRIADITGRYSCTVTLIAPPTKPYRQFST
jgi:hypothetical protein